MRSEEYIHKLTGERMTFIKAYNQFVWKMKGKSRKIVGLEKTNNIYICMKSNLIPTQIQGRLF